MKKLTTLLAAMAILFVMSGKAQAVPMYYTFEGTVTEANDDAGAIASQLGAGFGVGSTVAYTLIVDFDAAGFHTQNDGTYVAMPDNATMGHFYADYYSGDALEQVDGGVFNDPLDMAEMNYGYEYFDGTYSGFDLNTDDDWLNIYSDSALSGWVVGTLVSGYNRAYNSSSDYILSELYADLQLTGITPVNAVSAVPEPSTLLLLGSGMLGLLAFRRRQATTQA